MKKVYFIDLIGTFSGMDYYDKSFARELQVDSFEVDILSTFSLKGTKPFLKVMYRENTLLSIYYMIWNYFSILRFMLLNKKAAYVFMSYGEKYDLLFLSLAFYNRLFFVDIHELFSEKMLRSRWMQTFFRLYYKQIIKNTIYHSERTLKSLNDIGYKRIKLYVPHFKYTIDNTYNSTYVGKDVSDCFGTDKVKLLFFGNIRRVKGIDVVIDYFENCDVSDKVELVIAGKNVENINLDGLKRKYKVIDRHIGDDELKFLYSKTNYVLLPYKESSQSGILEMAFSFRKPMLLSNISYFASMINRFPSFGRMIDIGNFNKLLDEIIYNDDRYYYYSEKDCKEFMMEDEINKFKEEFKQVLLKP